MTPTDEAVDSPIVMHSLLHSHFQEGERLERRKLYHDIHTWLFERLTARIPDRISEITPDHDALFLEATTHALAMSEEIPWKWLARAQSILGQAKHHLTYQSVLEIVLAAFEIRSANNDVDILSIRHERACQMGSRGLHKQAIQELTLVFDSRNQIDELGPLHPQTLTTRYERARQMGALGHHQEALREFSQIQEIESRSFALDPEHPACLATRHERALQLSSLRRHGEALVELTDLHEIAKHDHEFGPVHARTLITRHNRAFQLGALGRHREAFAELTDTFNIRKRPDSLGQITLIHSQPKPNSRVKADIWVGTRRPFPHSNMFWKDQLIKKY